MFKIKSKFYVIYGDGAPIYVGFTSRTIKQRFLEHKKSKDFSDYEEVRVEELTQDELDFDFTWDYNIIESESDEVSQREAELVKKFGTQNSEFQKANGGGVVWNNIKYFVLTNKDNPKYREMSGTEIHTYLESRKKEKDILRGFIRYVRYPSEDILYNSVRHIDYPSKIILGNFISGVNYPSRIIVYNFISGVNYPSTGILCNFVKYVRYPSKGILRNFINGVNHPSTNILHNFISNMHCPSRIILISFIGNMKIKREK